MEQFKAIDPRVEVNGQTVLAIANGMDALKSMGLKFLAENNIADPTPEQWYSQQDWLNAFKQIAKNVGPSTLVSIGQSIPKNAAFPSDIHAIENALAMIDVAYHMNHRLHGKPLFDPKTGTMTEGIGHYRFQLIKDNKAEILCDNPYPCFFDRGIIDAMAKKFGPSDSFIVLKHDDAHGCRDDGQDSCRYVITW